MGISDTFKEGFLFAQKYAGAKLGSGVSERYLTTINKAIEDGVNSILSTKSRQTPAQMGGFVAERYHAASFNIRAAATGSTNHAVAGAPGASGALNRNAYGSVDVSVMNSKDVAINNYGSKYYKTPSATAKQQATLTKTGKMKYEGQLRLVPADQEEQVRSYSLNPQSKKPISEEQRKAFLDVSEKTRSTITDGKIESKGLSKSESETIAQEIKDGNFNPNEHGLGAADNILGADIMRKAVGAGLNAALITALMKAAPDLFKGVDYLIKNGKIDIDQLKATGMSALSGAADGFFRGFFACALQVMCNSGKLGKAFVNADPLFIGTTVALMLETVKNAVDVARGKQTIREMGAALIDSVAISTSYVIGSSMANVILMGAMGFALPVVGFLLGSLIGSSLASLYNIGKNKFLSFCVDSGFTCFGLVDQDYTLPTEALKELGIDTTPIERVEVARTEIGRVEIGTTQVNRTNFETIQLVILKRGIIGVNKVGYLIK